MSGRPIVFLLCVGLMGCKSLPGVKRFEGPIVLAFDGQPGSSTEMRYYNVSRMLTYEGKQLVRDRTESVDFSVVTEVKAKDAKTGYIRQTVKTIRKDGVIPLHDLSFPEMGEKIDYILKANGEVVKAGKFPPDGLFYVPSLPMPKGPVRVGDTWPMEHMWLSAREGVPLKLEVTAILKDIVTCEGDKTCADLEISGHVKFAAGIDQPGSKFTSRLWGRVLFSLSRGDVIWSETRSREDVSYPEGRMAVS